MSVEPAAAVRKNGALLRTLAFIAVAAIAAAYFAFKPGPTPAPQPIPKPELNYAPRTPGLDTSGFQTVGSQMTPWPAGSSLEQVAAAFSAAPQRILAELNEALSGDSFEPEQRISLMIPLALVQNYLGRTEDCYAMLGRARAVAEEHPAAAERHLYTIIYLQGVTALRIGEDENCVMCRGESSCILPLGPSALHAKPKGSRLAIRHLTEYLDRFPTDFQSKWLLNVAHMTLGEHPHLVDPEHCITLDAYLKSEFDIGRFRDIGAAAGVNAMNFQGGGAMDDFDNDGRLDIATTSNHPAHPMSFFINRGDGTFEDRTKAAGLLAQTGGLYCVQADFDNDGRLDLFIPRGAWLPAPVRGSLLRNTGNGAFEDVTVAAGLAEPMNSLSACWADYDNDGFVDLFVPCGPQPSRLYRNRGNGTFENVSERAGVAGNKSFDWRSACWIDFDRDGHPDLFVNSMRAVTKLYRNRGDGTFANVSAETGIDGPRVGFACWNFDYDNDGWPDLFATCYEYPIEDVVNGLTGKPHTSQSNRLYRNLGGKKFQDVTREAGLDLVFATMGCNFGDFDGDGRLDFYLATGGPDLAALVPNRMFKNVDGKRFAEITRSSGTGNIQKGHSVACGDWDRNGTLDIFTHMGGVTFNTRYHNILFQNPGRGNNWLNVKLVGAKSNRSAIGTRIALTAGGTTIHREVTTGSSFGANPLEQMIGIGTASRIEKLEIEWPATKTRQVFHDLEPNRAIEVAEDANMWRPREYAPIPTPK